MFSLNIYESLEDCHGVIKDNSILASAQPGTHETNDENFRPLYFKMIHLKALNTREEQNSI